MTLTGLTSAVIAATPAPPQPLVQGLAAVHQRFSLNEGRLSGDGAATLRTAMAKSRLVAVGEEHLSREMPAFVGVLCNELAPQLSGLAMELGPRALAEVTSNLRSADRLKRMAAFDERYPAAIAFLDDRSDNDMAADCLRAQPHVKLIGLDQEFLGSAGFLIDLVLREKLSAEARQQLLRLQVLQRAADRKAGATGKPDETYLLTAADADLRRARTALECGGTVRARAIFADLERSRSLYLNQTNASNQKRANLLKSNLRAGLPRTGKVLIKMGEWHTYRGYNPLNNRDIGNWIAEHADQEGVPSLHIMLVGERGVHALFGGYQRPLKLEPFVNREDSDFSFLATALNARGPVQPGSWDIFDLRPLRDRHFTDVDVVWRRNIGWI